ncbi:hypothetical protein CS797_03245 [Campylobacter jejuni]|uniref:hypothetical protein n=1 Tax=Campylobacter TaxID=194 RepID=UPI001067987D|nr:MULTISPECIES: hypothetical protein [Campylobacter]TEY38794.1 hypothetical protein ELQ27_03095 [Campylobacter sp. CH185]EAJ1453071.1 hypothetical protein [Campylobacter jejuni]EDO8215506.1 hypothetical protein [Campylobacter jejuni]MBX1795694.1 hypothetical protein [Campylobacter jejuni]MCW1870693.1 hypothetical protein [Campylobacter jejuni]
MDKAHLIAYLVSLAFIVTGLIVCCILYLFKDKINKITPENIENINSNIKDFIEKNICGSSSTIDRSFTTNFGDYSSISGNASSSTNYFIDPTYSYMPENIYHNNQD